MAWDKETELRLRQVIKDSGVNLLKENLVQGTWGNTAARLDEDHMLVTPTGLDYIALTPEDMPVVQISDPSIWSDGKKPTSERKIHAAIMAARPEINATIPTVLDDMAQIVGPKCKTASNDIKSILCKLKGCNSCLIKDDGCITTGRSLDEAYTCVLVLDKAAHCYVSSAVIGKNKTINIFEAKLMQFIYKKKYSKANQENLQVSEEE